MIYPERLKPGDTIGLVAPCSAISADRAERCIEMLENMGFRVKAADNLAASKGGFMAGDEKMRAEWKKYSQKITDMFEGGVNL